MLSFSIIYVLLLLENKFFYIPDNIYFDVNVTALPGGILS